MSLITLNSSDSPLTNNSKLISHHFELLGVLTTNWINNFYIYKLIVTFTTINVYIYILYSIFYFLLVLLTNFHHCQYFLFLYFSSASPIASSFFSRCRSTFWLPTFHMVALIVAQQFSWFMLYLHRRLFYCHAH